MDILGHHSEYNGFDVTLERYQQALAHLERLGVRIANNSRLRNAERRLANLPPDPSAPIALEIANQLLFDLREMDEIVLIAESFPEPPNDAERERLRFLGSGTDHPDEDTATRSRDAQFELYLRAALRLGGSSITIGNPDLTLLHQRGEIPIEAKRPFSADRLDDRLRDALAQLSRQPNPGFVAISLDHIIRPAGGILGVPEARLIQPAVSTLMMEFVSRNARSIANRVRGHRLAGVLFVFRTPARALNTGLSLLGSHFHVDGAVDPNGPEWWIVDAIGEAFERSRI